MHNTSSLFTIPYYFKIDKAYFREKGVANRISKIDKILSNLVDFGADNRNRTCMKSLSYGPEPYASTNSAISAIAYLVYHRNIKIASLFFKIIEIFVRE